MNRTTAIAFGLPVALVALLSVACTVGPNTKGASNVAALNAQTKVATAQIEGTVVVNGAAVSGAQVAAVPVGAAPGIKTYTGTTDDAGHFTLSMPIGNYNLIASKDGSNLRAVKWAVQTATTVDLNLVPTGNISGKVTSDPPVTMTGTLVFVPGTSFIAALDANGNYVINGVPAGTVSVEVMMPRYTPALQNSVVVTAGQTTANINLALTGQANFASVSGAAPAGQADSAYVGAETCKVCHSGYFSVYSQTAHWTTRDRLASGAVRGTCQSCHVAGQDPTTLKSVLLTSGATAGYDFSKPLSLSDSVNAKFIGIQCENCHGPGANHVAADATHRATTITSKPSYVTTCNRCHNTAFNKTYAATGVTDDVVNASGGNVAPHHPQSLSYMQYGGYEYGQAIPTSAHNTMLGNGCIDCHMSGEGPENHEINNELNQANMVANVCQACHGTNFTGASIKAYQAQGKLAAEALGETLSKYRSAFCEEVAISATDSTHPAKVNSTESVDIANTAYKCSKWDDSPDIIRNAPTASHSGGVNPITSASTTWSTHMTTYDRAFYNWDLYEADKSWGLHSPGYLQSLLRLSYNALATDLNTVAPTGSYEIMNLKR